MEEYFTKEMMNLLGYYEILSDIEIEILTRREE